MKKTLVVTNYETNEKVKVALESEGNYNSTFEALVEDLVELRMSGWGVNTDWSAGAEAYRDINPHGPMAHDLPHSYLPLTGYDRRTVNGEFIDDDGLTCQFTAGGQRCQATRAEHKAKWPELS
jgi:hypothetical protein